MTNVDTLNLEIALGARARNPSMPIVLRIAEATFADSIARHFDFKMTFSVAALAGPVFAGLSRLAGARGHIEFGGRDFSIVALDLSEEVEAQLPPGAIVLAVGEDDGEFKLIRDFAGLGRGARVLVLVPLKSFRREGEGTLATVQERAYGA